MANPYTATAQIASAKRRGWIPDATGLTTEDLLGLFNEEQRVYVTALLKSVREEYLVREADHDVPLVAGQSQYRLPSRCIGGALRSVALLDPQGCAVPITRVEPENDWRYPGTGSPVAFKLRGGAVQVLPTPSGGGTLRLGYLQRLSTVVSLEECGEITAIDTGTGEVTFNAVDEVPTDFVVTAAYDFVRGGPGFETLAIDQTPTDVTANVATFATLPAELAVGDFLALAGETPIPQVPVECHYLLAQRVVVKILEATDSPRAKAARETLEGSDGKGGMRGDVMALLSPRVTASSRVIVNPNGPGMRRRRY